MSKIRLQLTKHARTLESHESPTGQELGPGDAFEADIEWYNARRHWRFLRRAPATPSVDEPGASVAGERVMLEDLTLDQLREIAVEHELKKSGSKAELIERIREHMELLELEGEEE